MQGIPVHRVVRQGWTVQGVVRQGCIVVNLYEGS